MHPDNDFNKEQRTITNQGNPSMVPGLKKLVLEINLGNQILGSSIDKVANSASIRHLMMNNLGDGSINRLWLPFSVGNSSLLLLGRELDNKTPGNAFAGDCNDRPLK
jgi:hypothetical protein